MSRLETDPRILRIVRALDRALASPHADNGVVRAVGSMIVEQGNFAERFDGWEPNAVRAVVLAFALHAPEDELEGMAEWADDEYRWVEWWDADGADIACGLKPDPLAVVQ